VKNGGSSSVTLTFPAQTTALTVSEYGTLSLTDYSVTVAAGDETMAGPFPHLRFDDSSGFVHVTYDQTGSITVAAIKVLKP
jgi:hypothetical protein